MKPKKNHDHIVVTPQWLNAVLFPRGPWTQGQLALLGVAWPAPPGWTSRILGIEISVAMAAKIEDLPYD